MNIDEATAAINAVKSGKRPRNFDWNDWERVEDIFHESGNEEFERIAHSEKMRAYHIEEYEAGLL